MANILAEFKLNRDIEKLQKEGMESSNYYLANSEYGKRRLNSGTYESKKYFYELINNWDHIGSIPKATGESIEQFINSDQYYFGLHRSEMIDGANYENDETLESILTDGLAVQGDLSSGAIKKNADPSKTISFCPDILTAVALLKSTYKGSTGAVLVAVPKDYINNEGHIINGHEEDLYDYDSKTQYLKPEFIMGFMTQINSNCQFHTKDEILDGYKKGAIK